MISISIDADDVSGSIICINDALTDVELRPILARLENEKDKEIFGLVCKKWLWLQSTERKKLAARAGTHMLRRMVDRFTRLVELDLAHGCKDVADDAMKLLATACRSNVKNSRMDWCPNISHSSLSCILSQCRNLEALDIGCCEEVIDAAFQLISSKETGLSLKVNNCPKITVAGIGVLAGKCTYLEYLDVRSCPHIAKAGLDEAGFCFPECCEVNFNDSMNEPVMFL
ncbi:unnamed protein product [Lupinus luteus]|uniref:Uncharacterized protein n=1 Tax=Lupinus luteus TaxID=3873 RepID=A0AAV1X3Y9_LUPLU